MLFQEISVGELLAGCLARFTVLPTPAAHASSRQLKAGEWRRQFWCDVGTETARKDSVEWALAMAQPMLQTLSGVQAVSETIHISSL